MAASNVRAIEQPADILHRTYADWTTLYQGNLDAMLASGKVVISGCRDVGAELLAFCQSRMKTSLDAGREFAGCTSPDAVLELQIEFAKSALKAYVDEYKKVGELSGKLVSEALGPLRARTGQVVSKARESAAA